MQITLTQPDAAFLIVLNLYPNIIGFGFFQNDEWVFLSPILSDAFFSYLPFINILGLLEIVLSIILLRQGLWQTWTRITRAALELGNIALAVGFCEGTGDLNESACWSELSFYAGYNFHPGSQEVASLCGSLPSPWKENCPSGRR